MVIRITTTSLVNTGLAGVSGSASAVNSPIASGERIASAMQRLRQSLSVIRESLSVRNGRSGREWELLSALWNPRW
jgi:hypothetical protein